MFKPVSVLLLTLALPFSAPAREATPADEKPVPIVRPAPRYTAELREKRIEGEVLVAFTIDVEGRVKNATVVRSTHPALEAPALEAVRKWLFRPGLKDGVPVETRARLPLTFALADEAAPPKAPSPRFRR